MFQDIRPYRLDNQYRNQEAKKNDLVLYYHGSNIYALIVEGKMCLPSVEAVRKVYEGDLQYLFSIDDTAFFWPKERVDFSLPEYEFMHIQKMRITEPKHLAYAVVVGHSLMNWYNSRRYCGRCGKMMIHDEKERMMKCPECRNIEYPKLSPATIIGVTDGDRILFSKYGDRDYHHYALLAGFAEIGETIEETVHREVMEEVGLKVKNLKYYKSQPWPFSDSLLMGFFCELDGDDQIILDETELSEAVWFNREDIVVKPDGVSLTNEMMRAFKMGLE